MKLKLAVSFICFTPSGRLDNTVRPLSAPASGQKAASPPPLGCSHRINCTEFPRLTPRDFFLWAVVQGVSKESSVAEKM